MTSNWFAASRRFKDPNGARRMMHFVDALGRFPTGRLVDLGAGHGWFAQLAADLGWEVTAVDARGDRFPDDGRITWVVSDVREFDDYAGADVVSCLGLWYHLTLDDQLQLARRVSARPLIIDTHVATQRLPRRTGNLAGRLSPVVERQGYTGRLYTEADLQDRSTASWGNDQSFWPSPRSLERQLYAAGYDFIDTVSPSHAPGRGFFVARTINDRARRETLISRYIPVVDADAAPTAPLPTLAPVVRRRPRTASPDGPGPATTPGIRDSTGHVVTAVRLRARAGLRAVFSLARDRRDG